MDRKFSFDFIRIVACILVLTVHVSALFFGNFEATSLGWSITNLYNCLGIIGVPLFFMLSGALLLNPQKPFSYHHFFFHNFVKIFLSYVFIIFMYNTAYFLMDLNDHSLGMFVEEVVKLSLRLSGHNIGHTWFIPALLALYLLTPLLRRAFADEKACSYFIILFLILGIVFYTFSLFGIKYYAFFEGVYKQFTVDVFLNYTGYFCLGHYLANFDRNQRITHPVFAGLVAFLGIVMTVMANQIVTSRTGESTILYNTPFYLGHFCTAFGLFALILYLFRDHRTSGRICRLVAGLTFPIYLFHPLIILILEECKFPFYFATPLIAIPLEVFLVLVLTGLLSFVWVKVYKFVRRLFPRFRFLSKKDSATEMK